MNTKPPIPIAGEGTIWAMQQILGHFQTVAPKPKKPKAVKTDPEQGEPARCYTCRGDSRHDDKGCPTCFGIGDLPELQSVDMTVYRDFDEVPVQVSIRDGEILDAWVVATVGEKGEMPRWAEGTDIILSLEEATEAKEALKR